MNASTLAKRASGGGLTNLSSNFCCRALVSTYRNLAEDTPSRAGTDASFVAIPPARAHLACLVRPPVTPQAARLPYKFILIPVRQSNYIQVGLPIRSVDLLANSATPCPGSATRSRGDGSRRGGIPRTRVLRQACRADSRVPIAGSALTVRPP